MLNLLKKLQPSTYTTALRMGGYIGWLLTVIFICRQSLHYYRDDSMLVSVNTTFLTATAATSAVLVVVLLLLDFEGLLSDKIMKRLPGVFMAETGIALSLANAATMRFFAAVAGVSAAFGMLAVLSHLLRVKVGQRMNAIGMALALGGLIRLIAGRIISATSQDGLLYVSIGIGIIAAMTVHSIGFSRTDGPLVSFAEAAPKTIISKVPYVYIVLFFCNTAFYMAFGHAESVALTKIPGTYLIYDAVSYAAFIAAAIAIACVSRLHILPIVYVCGTGLAATAAIFSMLPYFTGTETTIIAIVGYCAKAAVTACVYMFIILFSLDRPHPLFYAMLGYFCSTCGELMGVYLDSRISLESMRLYILLLLLLMPVGGGLMAAGMRKYGFSGEQLDHRHMLRGILRRKGAELRFSAREQMMLESVVLEGSDIEELSNKLLFSHNTVKVLLRPILSKLRVSDLNGVRSYFSVLSEDEQQHIAMIQAAEQEKREQLRRDKADQLRQSLLDMLEEKESVRSAQKQEIAELTKSSEIVDAEMIDLTPEEAQAVEEAQAAEDAKKSEKPEGSVEVEESEKSDNANRSKESDEAKESDRDKSSDDSPSDENEAYQNDAE